MTAPSNRPTAPVPPQAGASLRTVQAAGVAGLIFAVLMTASMLLIRSDPPEGLAGLRLWWSDVASRYLLALYLFPFAGIAFLWFLAVVRLRIGRLEDQFYATVFIGSGLLFITMWFAAGASASAAAGAASLPDDAGYAAAVAFARDLSRAYFYIFAIKMAAAFMLVTSTIGRRTGVLPRWFIILGVVAGLVLLASISFFELFALVFPGWVAILSCILLLLRPNDWEHLRTAQNAAPAGTPGVTGAP